MPHPGENIMEPSNFWRASALIAACLAPELAWACSSCGCSLSTDWASQGLAGGTGWRADFRYDYFDQTQLRTGTGKVDRAGIAFPAEREIQQGTTNRNYNAFIDYSPRHDLGVTVHVPYFDRYHTTIIEGDTDVSTSNTSSLGDVRILGRYLGFSDDHSFGVQLGVKLPTGSFHNTFIAGPQTGQPLDRGLQPGTGTTDLLVGVFKFGALNRDWDYFAQAILQQPMNSREDFKPGTGLNMNFGVRYMSIEAFTPQLQINVRSEKRESGANADIDNSGATLVYLSPGMTFNLAKSAQAYAFVQIPLYQNVNGFQIEPRYTVSVGARLSF
jgi:hypothetical protein